MKPTMKWLAVLSLGGAMGAGPAHADYTYMGHCTDDPAVSPEDIISSCTGFISRALAENWQQEKIPAALLFQATAYERLEKYGRAEEILKSAVARYPAFRPAWVNLGRLLEKREGPGALMATMDAMVQQRPNDPYALNEACWMGATTGEELDTALADCNAALQLKPGDVNILDSRALANLRQGNFAAAIADATAALAKNPKLAGSLYVRGIAKLESGDTAGGAADIDAARAMDGKVGDTYAGYGVVP
ncbi:MAG TPA: tetratricopeptide repeat protein [Rhizomicrobium sp.]|nr:tetratricopeptide repeat protein [Rhizomicrobium sp.]